MAELYAFSNHLSGGSLGKAVSKLDSDALTDELKAHVKATIAPCCSILHSDALADELKAHVKATIAPCCSILQRVSLAPLWERH